MQTKTIVIFANSVKHGEHCVAGKCLATREWVRPVSDKTGASLNNAQVMYANKYGKYAVKPMQKIEMYFESHVPLINQPENYMISSRLWQQKFNLAPHELGDFLDQPDDLWGYNDRVCYARLANRTISIQQSLYLVKAANFSLVLANGKFRGQFNYGGHLYSLAITDPLISEKQADGISNTPILCISLGEEFNGNCYKLIANIL